MKSHCVVLHLRLLHFSSNNRGGNLYNLECHNTREICSMRSHLLILHFETSSFLPSNNKGKNLHPQVECCIQRDLLPWNPRFLVLHSSLQFLHHTTRKKPHVELTPQQIMHYCAVMADMINALYGIIIAWFTLQCLQYFLEDAGLREKKFQFLPLTLPLVNLLP